MPRGVGYSIGKGLGSGLSAFLTERANKDLREEQELQRRNLKSLLAAYIDPKTELGSGAMAELQLGTKQIPEIQAEQPETYKDIIDRMRIEGLKDLTPDELKKELYGIPLPKEEKLSKAGAEALASPLPDFLIKRPREQIAKDILAAADPESYAKSFLESKRAKDITGIGSLTATIESRIKETEDAQKAYDRKVAYIKKGGSGTDFIPNREKDKRIKELGERPPDYQIPKNISALADSVEAGRIDPEIAAALAGFEPEIEQPKTFHGATSYEDAEAGLNKNYEAGIISKEDRDEGLIEAREFFGVE
jgi:hypothetical protein